MGVCGLCRLFNKLLCPYRKLVALLSPIHSKTPTPTSPLPRGVHQLTHLQSQIIKFEILLLCITNLDTFFVSICRVSPFVIVIFQSFSKIFNFQNFLPTSSRRKTFQLTCSIFALYTYFGICSDILFIKQQYF